MPDLSVMDAATGDMATRPCTDGFPLGTQGVWACRGKFSPTTTKASALCQNGFKLCADGYKLTDAECSSMSLTSFFCGSTCNWKHWIGCEVRYCYWTRMGQLLVWLRMDANGHGWAKN